MGAAPSRETHRHGLFLVPQCNYNKKQDIVMIPLTREFFPSPDCPLFVQFHEARCSAAVNYYFRRPGNPGDLSRIPNYADAYREENDKAENPEEEDILSPSHGDENDLVNRGGRAPGKDTKKGVEQTASGAEEFIGTASEWEATKVGASSYPSREALYHGVIESIEETLFDTDQEMREAYAKERAYAYENYGTQGAKRRKVLPVMCAVAFRHEISKTPTSGEVASPSAAHPMLSSGVNMGNCIVNIVGCFGFVPVQDEVEAAQQEGFPTELGTLLGSSVRVPPQKPDSHTSSECSSHSPATSLPSIMHVSGHSILGRANRFGIDGRGGDLPMTLPASAAAPLAAMVFLTKSAGEQKLSHVTYVAASTYYFQMIQAGVISRRCSFSSSGMGSFGGYYNAGPGWEGGGGLSYSPPPDYLPPLEMFSFSSLITNIPVLSFLYEMKYRWGYLGVLRSGTPTAPGSLEGSTVSLRGGRGPRGGRHVYAPGGGGGGPPPFRRWGMGNHSSGGLSIVVPDGGQDVTDEMEMWITPDQMIHGRISSSLAARLCWSLVERPDVIQERVLQLPSQETGYWRYRGLVDRAHPPPLPSALTPIDPKDVYVVSSDVLRGFDEGDILRFDAARKVWFVDYSIPLEGVVLAAMRPHCKRARESDPQDPGWVTRLVPVEEVAGGKGRGGGMSSTFPVPPPTPEQAAIMEANPGRYKLVHESMGNFYVYRFKHDGTTYYHGTVPDFANPKKKQPLPTIAPLDSIDIDSSSELPATTHLNASVTSDENPVKKVNHSSGPPAETAPTVSPYKVTSTPSASGQVRKSILNALFLDPQSARDDPAPVPGANFTPTVGNDGVKSVFPRPACRQDYLANRVTSAALDAARSLMRNLYSYAYNFSASTAPLASAANPPRETSAREPTPVEGGRAGLTITTPSNAAAGVPASPVRQLHVPPSSEGSLLDVFDMNGTAVSDGTPSQMNLQLTQPPKRYTERGSYVWDWRRVKSDTVGDTEEANPQNE